MSLTLLKNLDIATSDESTPVSISPAFGSTEEPQVSMRVQKRNGSFEPVDVNKIVRAVARCSVRLTHVDPLTVIPAKRIWVNPDCGLKTRGWPEVEAALINMMRATRLVRERFTEKPA